MMSPSDPFLKPIQPIDPEDRDRVPPAVADELLIREEAARGEIKIFIPEELAKIGGYLALIFSLTSNLETAARAEALIVKKRPLTPLLRRFYNHLKELTYINQSKNIAYSSTLTLLWNEILSSREASPLIQEMQTYPQGAKYSLGYYLSEYAGQSWFPFPYIELLEKLHQEHMRDPKHSQLQKWLNLLESLV